MSQATVEENPLVPHGVLLRMYAAMETLRIMEPAAAAQRGGARTMRGEEACRASSLLSLEAGDMVSDVAAGAPRGKNRRTPVEALAPGTVSLVDTSGAEERLMLAVGAAAALRAQGGNRLVLAYVGKGELSAAQWKHILGMAGRSEAAVIFFLLPGGDAKRQGEVSDKAQGWGVPGMPVDAMDAVALYRVMQESVLRARSGDGPALIEAVQWRPMEGETAEKDALRAMRRLLVEKGLIGRNGRTVPQGAKNEAV